MQYKRILTIQDISCVGQCSMTVALPILSACGCETCILPTAVLSTHTGGFGAPVVAHLDESLGDIRQHWQKNGIQFDAILVGYLGSLSAVKAAGEMIEQMLAPGGASIVDPAMADHGKLYAGFDKDYVCAMTELCGKADIIIPNLTEATMLTEIPYDATIGRDYVNQLLDGLGEKTCILTGVGFEPASTGVVVSARQSRRHYAHPKTAKSYHGTGDMFAACFTGALMQGKTMYDAAKIAADFVCRAIDLTEKSPAHWYGVKFELALPELIKALQA